MYRVVVLQPTNEFCGGDPEINEKAAINYASMPTGILITRSNELRKVKFNNKGFFITVNENYKNYTICDRGLTLIRRGWYFDTKKEAAEKLMLEARWAGHHIKTPYGWTKIT